MPEVFSVFHHLLQRICRIPVRLPRLDHFQHGRCGLLNLLVLEKDDLASAVAIACQMQFGRRKTMLTGLCRLIFLEEAAPR